MLTNNFYRGIGYLVMGIFIQTQFYSFLFYLILPPCVSFPSTQYYLVSLQHFYCIFVFCSFPPPCLYKKSEANKLKAQCLKVLIIKSFSPDLCRDPSIFNHDAADRQPVLQRGRPLQRRGRRRYHRGRHIDEV